MHLTLFDLDHTLIKTNCSFQFGMYLFRRNFFSFGKLLLGLADYIGHNYFNLSLKTLHANAFKRIFRGHSLPLIETHADQFLDKYFPFLLNKAVVERLKLVQQRGDMVAISSSSPAFLVAAIAKRLNIQEWQGTTYLVDEQKIFTTIGHVVNGFDKADYIQSLTKKLNLPLASTTVYSDSYSDLPILRLAGKAVGVNPDVYLKRMCMHMGWEIICKR